MSTTTTTEQPRQAVAASLPTLTLGDLARMSIEELDVVYELSFTPAVAALHGPLDGLPLAGNEKDPVRIAEVWKGKVFAPLSPTVGYGTNRIVKDGQKIYEFEFRYTPAKPLQGTTPVIALDYALPLNPPPVQAILDNLKQVNGQLFLGTANQKTAKGFKFLLYFGLQYPG
ncbi:MAG TPA: hypothetical protein VGG06_11445 [Thermoanaerobaculia bacterium]|jgi:hypothetical protein